ncbi:MAG: hypothetical protein KC464_35190, partial [Myxococcales bacterium]|nr:hypothetical protein [Myxococcales bacterium]
GAEQRVERRLDRAEPITDLRERGAERVDLRRRVRRQDLEAGAFARGAQHGLGRVVVVARSQRGDQIVSFDHGEVTSCRLRLLHPSTISARSRATTR